MGQREPPRLFHGGPVRLGGAAGSARAPSPAYAAGRGGSRQAKQPRLLQPTAAVPLAGSTAAPSTTTARPHLGHSRKRRTPPLQDPGSFTILTVTSAMPKFRRTSARREYTEGRNAALT